jgi:integrase
MQKLSKSQQVTYSIAYNKIKKYKKIDIVNSPISEITIDILQDIVNASTSTYHPARDIKNLFSQFYKRAMAQQDVAVNLAAFITLPNNNEVSQIPFNENELKKLWKHYGEGNKFTAYILLMIYSGMMPGELFIAKKQMIDWERQQIIGCGLKTKKRREAPIIVADFMIPVLEEICLNSKKDKLLVMSEDKFYSGFHETLAECGIEDRKPYACRHTTATALALGNIAPGVIQEIMRHTKFETTKRYIHQDLDTAPMLIAVNTLKNG